MLRGLVIRQGFVLGEGFLGLVIIAIALLAIRDLYFPSTPLQDSDLIEEPSSSAVTLRDPVGSRNSYESIIASKIFGKAAAYAHNKPKKPAAPKVVAKPKPSPIVETKLPLRLIGTLSAGKNSPFSSATIEITGKDHGKRAFFVGDDIIENVRLTRVAKNKIWIENKGKNEILSYKFEIVSKSKRGSGGRNTVRSSARPKPTTSRPARTQRPTQQRLVTIDRGPTIKKLEAAYKRLASTIDVLEVKDDDGKLIGLSTPNIESIPELSEYGFKNGDVLVSVNNEKVTSQNQITQLANKYKNATVVRIAYLRDGQLMNTTYRLRG